VPSRGVDVISDNSVPVRTKYLFAMIGASKKQQEKDQVRNFHLPKHIV
jgi:hypothetical protein